MSESIRKPNESKSDSGEQSAVNGYCNGEFLDETFASDRCLNCGSVAEGCFCASCGQAKILERLSFKKLFWEIPSRFLNFDRGLLLTFHSLLVRPGAMARDYVYGQRKKYVNPFAYFLFGASVQLLSFWSSAPILREVLEKNLNDSIQQGAIPADTVDSLQKIFGPDPAAGITDIYAVAIAQSYTYAALLFFALPFAVFLRLFHGVAGSRYRLAEHTVFSTYVVAQLLIITAITTPLIIRINFTAQSLAGPAIYVLYTLYAQSGFYPGRWKHTCLTLVSLLSAMVIFFASILAIFIGSLVVSVLLKVS